jgi:hypothetical protein
LKDDISKISDAEASMGFEKLALKKDTSKIKSPVLDKSNLTKSEKMIRELKVEGLSMVQKQSLNLTKVTLKLVKT